jgi:hypothetical protein
MREKRNMEKAISYRVMKTHEFKDGVFYRIACDCVDKDHDVSIQMKYENFGNGIITVSFGIDLEWSSYWANTWYGKIWERIKGTFRMLLTGKM